MEKDEIENEIRLLESQRSRALLENDGDMLKAILADDLVHIHSSGAVDTKQSYLEGIKTKWEFLKIERPEITVKVYGDSATMTGPIEQEIRFRETEALVKLRGVVTQFWVKQADGWVQTSFQATRVE